jgi:hypothetical protein
MITTINIKQLKDFKSNFITKILKEMLTNYGEIEIVIKPKMQEDKPDIIHRIQEVEKGGDLLSFTDEEFDQLNEQLLEGKKPQKDEIRKTQKHEPGHYLSK